VTSKGKTTVQVAISTRNRLRKLQEYPDEKFDSIIDRLIEKKIVKTKIDKVVKINE